MDKQITPAIFFRELYSYMGYGGELASSTNFIQGIGEAAAVDIPEMYDKFGSIRGMLQLTWTHTLTSEDSVFSKKQVKSVPLIMNTKEKTGTLFLPVTQIRIPMDSVDSDVYPFRDDYDGAPVTLVVYKDAKTPVITLALLLRNNKVSPWTIYFSYLIDKITRTGKDLCLVFPRVDIDTRAGSNKSFYQTPVRITSFKLADITKNTSVATLTLIPDLKGVNLLTRIGL